MNAPAVPAFQAAGAWTCNAVADCHNKPVVQWAWPSPTNEDPDRTVPVFACATHEGA